MSSFTWPNLGGAPSYPLLPPNGSASAPSYSFASATNTGIYLDGSSHLGFSVGGTEAAYVASDGLHASALIPTSLTVPTNGMFLDSANALGFSANSTEVMKLNTNGPNFLTNFINFGVAGNTSYDYFLHNSNVGYLYIGGGSSAGNAAAIILGGSLQASNPSIFEVQVNGNAVITSPQVGSVLVGLASLATTATDGFLYIPHCAGAPTGTATNQSGYSPIVFDTTNNKIWIYNGGAWKGVVVS